MNRHIAGIQRREHVACNKSGVYPVNKHRHAVCKFIMRCIAVSIFEKKRNLSLCNIINFHQTNSGRGI